MLRYKTTTIIISAVSQQQPGIDLEKRAFQTVYNWQNENEVIVQQQILTGKYLIGVEVYRGNNFICPDLIPLHAQCQKIDL